MTIIQNQTLKYFNTFGIEVIAKQFVEIQTLSEVKEICKKQEYSKFNILGGGSNILLTGDLEGLTLKNAIKGIQVISENEEEVMVSVGGGVIWHQFVVWALENNLGGIENLSLIPGTIGAAPIQNIGAYGVELEQVFDSLKAVHLETVEVLEFNSVDCHFGYRDSIFKNELKGKVFITQVNFKLSKKHVLNIAYGAIQQILEKWEIRNPSIHDVSKAVIHIRRSKLPDPAAIGNAGSFFKNPELELKHYNQLQKEFPGIVAYPLENGKIKVPAGWLIERAGWKGKRFGDAGCHERQALVLVNFGNASGTQIKALSEEIKKSVMQKFGVVLNSEVNIW